LTGVISYPILGVMHQIQEKLLALADTEDLGTYSYYALAKMLDVANHGSVKFHLDQLVDKGLLYRDQKTGSISKVESGNKFSGFMSIPIMGEANCGAPTMVADDRVKSFLRVSPALVPKVKLDRLYALKAVGESMNRANIGGKPIMNGDYVLIEKTDQSQNGDYVVSIFDEVANIKRFIVDYENSRIVLQSESTDFFPPMFVAEEDLGAYLVAGKVVQVIPA
jgi:SOS-response transcriptional repressor LexA